MNSKEIDLISEELADFVQCFADVFGWKKRIEHCKIYLTGLILDGERKSIDPLADRIDGANNQALQQFVNQSPWCGFELQDALRIEMISRFRLKDAIYILGDTSLIKRGDQSVGVCRQYCAALGRMTNCQSIVSFYASTDQTTFPLAARLYLSDQWTKDKERMEKVRVPAQFQKSQEKWKIAIDLLDQCSKDLKPSVVLFDSDYVGNRQFLKALDDRSIKFIGGLKGDEIFRSVAATRNSSGKNPKGLPTIHLAPQKKEAVRKVVKALANVLFADGKNIKNVIVPGENPVSLDYIAIRATQIVRGPHQNSGLERWLIMERLKDGSFKYYMSNYDAETDPERIVLEFHQRYKIDRGYQQLKDELGFDHFEGRSWNGVHHHIGLCFMAFNFLQTLIKNKSRRIKVAINSSHDQAS